MRPRLIAAAVAMIALLALVRFRPFGPVGLFLLVALVLSVAVVAVGWPEHTATPPITSKPGPAPAADRRTAGEPAPSDQQRWQRACAHHDQVLDGYGGYELDPVMLLRFPAMWDLAAPPVIAFHDALEQATALRTDRYPGRSAAAEYIDAVGALRPAWVAADRYARSTGTSALSDVDARDCERGLKLLRHADGAAAAERATYLGQVLVIIDRLVERGAVATPPRVKPALEQQVRKAIAAAPKPRIESD
jgi:hypothetical protein